MTIADPARDATAECFIAMPISDPEGYESGHFARVYQQMLAPACERAGYRPVRADDVRETNLIHLDVLRRLVDSPVVLCDLSARNPNVFFELGLRQAFDKPVVLVQELGTPRIFDVALLRITPYRPARIYDEVLEDQARIAEAIVATVESSRRNDGVNSIVRMLGLIRPADVRDEHGIQPFVQLVRAELDELRRHVIDSVATATSQGAISVWEQMLADVVEDYARAVDATDETDLKQVELASIETLRNRVYDEMNRFHGRTGREPTIAAQEFRRAEYKWRLLLERILSKPKDQG